MTGERWLQCWASGAGAWCCCVWGTLSCCFCQGKILCQCREWGLEGALAEKCHFAVWVHLQKQLIQAVCACAETGGGTAGAELGALEEWEWGWFWWQPRNAAEGALAKLSPGTWPGQALCQPSWGGVPRCSALPHDFWLFYRKNEFSLAGARVKPATRQSIS